MLTNPTHNYAPLAALITQHGGSPQDLAFVLEQTIRFLLQETRRGANQELRQALLLDLEALRQAFAGM